MLRHYYIGWRNKYWRWLISWRQVTRVIRRDQTLNRFEKIFFSPFIYPQWFTFGLWIFVSVMLIGAAGIIARLA